MKFERYKTPLMTTLCLQLFLFSGMAKALHYEDNFNSGIDTAWWSTLQPLTQAVQAVNGQIEITESNTQCETATYNQGLMFNYPITGDFTATVDYTFLEWLSSKCGYDGNGERVGLTTLPLTGPDSGWAGNTAERYANWNSPYERYGANFSGSYKFSATTDTAGTIKLTRVGNTFSAYYWNGSDYALMHQYTYPSDAPKTGGHSIQNLLLRTYAYKATPGVKIAFDNFTLDAPTTLVLSAEQWRLMGLPLDVGTANTVQDLFGDDLDPNTYASRWVLYAWDATNELYNALTLTSPLNEGQGYWLKTLDSGKSIGVTGTANPVPLDIDLVTEGSVGRKNMVGYPYNTEGCWKDAKVLDGASELSLAQADPNGTCWTTPNVNCVLSRLMHTWNGSAYQAFDGQTPGAEGTLNAFDGLWVKAFKSGIKLRLAGTCAASKASTTLNATATPLPAARPVPPRGEWWLRLTVASGTMEDPGNLLGRLGDSRNDYDAHDLPELAPLSPYLTLVFPRLDWGEQAGDYTTDYRRAGKQFQGGNWDFEVRSDEARTVTLVGAGSDKALSRSRLFDRETGRWLRPDAEGRYTLTMIGPVHRLRWQVK